MVTRVSSALKVIVITGASRGIGYSLAINLAKRGYIVCATVKKNEDIEKFTKVTKKFPNLYPYRLDVSSDKSVKQCIRKILLKHKKIDVLVNNAAYILFGPLETVSIQQLQEQYEVNVFGTVRVIQAVLPSMRRRQSGHILFMGSTSGVQNSPMYGAYASTKFALESIASSFASNLIFWKIKVSIVENSATRTKISSKPLKLGKRFHPRTNPYKQYLKNSLHFLREIISQGRSPETAAEAIAKVIENPGTSLRELITPYAKTVFNDVLKDPEGEQWLKAARDELKWFRLLRKKIRKV